MISATPSLARLFLAAVASVCLVSVCQAMSEPIVIEPVVLAASPVLVTDNVTTELVVDCRAHTRHARGAVFARIARTTANGTDTFFSSQGQTLVDDDRVFVTEGADGDWRFVSISIENPTFSDQGSYSCLAYYFGDDFKAHNANLSVGVVVEEQPQPPTEAPVIDEVVNVTSCDCGDVWEEIYKLKEIAHENVLLRQKLNETMTQQAEPIVAPVPQANDDECRVSFSAKMSNDAPLDSGSLVSFKDVISNKGQAFNQEAAMFVAPCDGQYFFSLTLRSQQKQDSGYVEGVILQDGEELARTFIFIGEAVSNYQTATNGAVTTLKKGQKVNVKVMTTSDGKLKSSAYSIFSGFYISP